MRAMRPTGGFGELGIPPLSRHPLEGNLIPGLAAAVARALINLPTPSPRRFPSGLLLPLQRHPIIPERKPNLLDLYLQRQKAYTRPDAEEEMRFEQFIAGR